MVREWFWIARIRAWRIHHTAYVENLCPRWYSNFSTARIRPMFPSWIRSWKAIPMFRKSFAIATTSFRLCCTKTFLTIDSRSYAASRRDTWGTNSAAGIPRETSSSASCARRRTTSSSRRLRPLSVRGVRFVDWRPSISRTQRRARAGGAGRAGAAAAP